MLVLGPGADERARTKSSSTRTTGKQTFTIKAEKVPNAAGIRRVIEMLGGPQTTLDDLAANGRDRNPQASRAAGSSADICRTGSRATARAIRRTPAAASVVVQDILPNALTHTADVVLPRRAWAEKDGTWENFAGKHAGVHRRRPAAGRRAA